MKLHSKEKFKVTQILLPNVDGAINMPYELFFKECVKDYFKDYLK